MTEESTLNYNLSWKDFEDLFGPSNETDPYGTHSNTINIVSIALCSLSCILGIPGNAIVIWIARFKMKRTVNTVWFLNLACADFLCCLSIPFIIAETVLDYDWPYGSFLCKVLPTVIVLNMFASVFTLTLISLDRFAQVIMPVWSQNHRSVCLAQVLCGAVWMVSFLLSLPSLIYRSLKSDHNQCLYGDGTDVKTIYVTRFVLGFMGPLLVIVVCYSLIAMKVRSSFSKSKKALKIILGVIIAFFVCWLPYHIVGLIIEYGDDLPLAELLNSPSLSLAYINSCVNPILYVFIGQDFKDKLRMSLRRALENAFSEDMTKSTVQSRGLPSRSTPSSEAEL
ncbi:hypothetical protein JZ751_011781 [Albula glossodonta]|uniref:G-protein coupled receptors family 1 profile domain-containing protein n=1 Tax=Albula glossodonta TaxID=121402 RepID=A0A8T2PQP8_9TELE|nr:hypothetical protein JZ751_011781 [Albula glossodonta]